MTSQEIIKYYKPSIIKLLISAIYSKREAEIDELWDKGWFTPQEYDRYKDKDLSYKQMIAIYNNRRQDWASDYIVSSYDDGYLDFEAYDLYMYVYELWLEGEIADSYMEQAMYMALLFIKEKRLEENNENEGE